jgi:hypothetical protein
MLSLANGENGQHAQRRDGGKRCRCASAGRTAELQERRDHRQHQQRANKCHQIDQSHIEHVILITVRDLHKRPMCQQRI